MYRLVIESSHSARMERHASSTVVLAPPGVSSTRRRLKQSTTVTVACRRKPDSCGVSKNIEEIAAGCVTPLHSTKMWS